MTTYNRHDPATLEYIETVRLPCRIEGVNVPENVNAANREALGLYPIQRTDTPPGMVRVANGWQVVDGVSVEVLDCVADAEYEAVRQAAKSDALKTAENNFLALCYTLGFTKRASLDELDTALGMMEAEADELPEYKPVNRMAHIASGLIHEVEIKGGSWYDIPDTPHEMEGDA